MAARGSGRGRAMAFFFRAEDGIRDLYVTGVQTCALPIFAEGEWTYSAHTPIPLQRRRPPLVVSRPPQPISRSRPQSKPEPAHRRRFGERPHGRADRKSVVQGKRANARQAALRGSITDGGS